MAEITGVWSPLCNLRNAHLISGSHSVCSRHRVLLGLGTAQGNPTSLGGCWIRPLNDTSWLNRHFGGSWSVNTEKQQPMSGLLGCQCTHAQFFIHQNAQVFCKSVLSDFSQSVPMSGTALTQVNLLNFLTLWSFSWTHFSSWTQVSCHCKVTKDALASTVRVSNEGIKEHQSQSPEGHRPSLASTWTWSYWSPLHPFSQFLTHWTVHPSNPHLSNLELRTPCGTSLKALQNSR